MNIAALLRSAALVTAVALIPATTATMAQVDGFRIAHLLLSGVFTGIFIGKFLRYARARSQQARAA